MDVKVTRESDWAYDPPRIESVLTAEELRREILYAGDLPSVDEDSLDP